MSSSDFTSTTAAKASGITPSTATAPTFTTPHQDTFLTSPVSVPAETTSVPSSGDCKTTPAVPGARPAVPTGPSANMSGIESLDSSSSLRDESRPEPTPTSTSHVPQPASIPAAPNSSVSDKQTGSPAQPQSSTDSSILNQQASQPPPPPQATSTYQPTPTSTYPSQMPPQTFIPAPQTSYHGQPTSTASVPTYYGGTQLSESFSHPPGYMQHDNTSRNIVDPVVEEKKEDTGILGAITQVVDRVNDWIGEKGGSSRF